MVDTAQINGVPRVLRTSPPSKVPEQVSHVCLEGESLDGDEFKTQALGLNPDQISDRNTGNVSSRGLIP